MNQELIDEIHYATSMGEIMTAFNKVSSVDEVGEFINIYGNDICNRQRAIDNLSFGASYMESPPSVRARLDIWMREQANANAPISFDDYLQACKVDGRVPFGEEATK